MNSCKLLPVSEIETADANETFRSDLVLRQVQKIISHPLFVRCKILKGILLYVVHETLSGRTNMIKEYTIAINVLHKPADYNMNQTGIVRIHAKRLRTALARYYREAADQDPIIISIPSGAYIPLFQQADSPALKSMRDFRVIRAREHSNPFVLAVIPFKTYERRDSRIAFCDSLGQNICTELNKMKNISLISYHAMRKLSAEETNFKTLAHDLDVNYVLTGDVQFGGAVIKVYVQLTETGRQTQIWSEVFQFNSTSSTFFKLSDYISSKITESITLLNIGPGQMQMNIPVTVQVK
ncbi:MAG TPA: hypothetical protein VFI33_05400 [Puia sp.]|nr:hypothetical protein [Puia sp.]